jgi:acetoin utilization deacetylase AcuC-like enzyme
MSTFGIGERIAVFHDARTLGYRMPAGIFDHYASPLLAHQIEQPENPERIANTCSVLAEGPLAERLDWHDPHEASDAELLTFHTAPYLETLKGADREGGYLSRSTHMSKGEMQVVRLSAGCAIDAAHAVLEGRTAIGYAISRPPSHHAQPAIADGYCFVNGVALAALAAREAGCARVAVIDWDVHHGNGTQEGFYGRADILTVSVHMDHGAWGPTHLQTGGVEETGRGAGEGANLNLPLPFGAGDRVYLDLFRRCIAPAVRRFAPDMIVVANGQDANQFDPNGRQCVTMAGFHGLAIQARELADACSGGRIIMTQEGGYNPTYAPLCAYAVCAGLLGEPLRIEDPIAFYPDDEAGARDTVDRLIARHPLL